MGYPNEDEGPDEVDWSKKKPSPKARKPHVPLTEDDLMESHPEAGGKSYRRSKP